MCLCVCVCVCVSQRDLAMVEEEKALLEERVKELILQLEISQDKVISGHGWQNWFSYLESLSLILQRDSEPSPKEYHSKPSSLFYI